MLGKFLKHKWILISVFIAIISTLVGSYVEITHRQRLGSCYESVGKFFNSSFVRQYRTDRHWEVVRQINMDKANKACQAEYSKGTEKTEWVYAINGSFYFITLILMIPYIWRFFLRRLEEVSKAIKGE